MQTLSIEGWGELATAFHAREPSWKEFVCHAIDEGMTVARDARAISPDLLATIRSIHAGIDAIAPPLRSGVVWADVSPENVLVDHSGGLVGLLDFESCIGAELCANLGYCFAAQLGTGFYDALRNAWVEEPTESHAARTELYTVVRAMRIAKFADRGPMPAGAPRPTVEQFLPGLRPAAESLRRWLEQRH